MTACLTSAGAGQQVESQRNSIGQHQGQGRWDYCLGLSGQRQGRRPSCLQEGHCGAADGIADAAAEVLACMVVPCFQRLTLTLGCLCIAVCCLAMLLNHEHQ